MGVTLEADRLAPFRRFSLYNSPYVAHDDGSAIDLYPPADANVVPSPVAGEVIDVRTVRAPPQPYAEPEDHLVLVDTGAQVARLMHVAPSVEPGEVIDRGDALGRPVRAGFFAPWVPHHLHLEFRPHGADPVRASGSVRLDVAVDVRGLAWDGTGTVVETGETWARLDSPEHPDPGAGFAGLGVERSRVGGEDRGSTNAGGRGRDYNGGKTASGVTGAGVTGEGRGSTGSVVDGGLPHYDSGGLLGVEVGVGADGQSDGGDSRGTGGEAGVRLAGQRIGTVDGRDVAWDDLAVFANGDPVRGIACYADRAETGVKLVGREVDLSVGESVVVEIRETG